MKPRILHLVDSFDEGGSERQALQLTRLLHESGRYEVHLASLKCEGVLRPDIEKLVGEIPSYPLTGFYDRNAITQLRRFVSHLRASKIDVLHTHDFYTNIFGMTAGFLAGVRVRLASRRETSGMRSTLQRQVQRVAYALAHQIVANSDLVSLKLIEEGMSTSRITVIHNGLEIERVMAPDMSRKEALAALGIGETTNTCERFVTIVANMRHDVKDYPMFLRAAQQVSKVVPNVGFLLAGEGELRDSIEELAAQLRLGGNTFFLGRCENLALLLNVSDVCVLSSKAEGFSNSILEYMAAARPVVATEVGGAKEAILEGETGYLVASGNHQLMAERIICLLRDTKKARSMGNHGRRLVEQKFSQAALLQKTESLYEKLLKQKRAAKAEKAPNSVGADLRGRPLAQQGRTLRCAPTRTGYVPAENEGAKPLRILVVAPSFDILGGQAVQAARLVSRLRELPMLEVGFLPINPRLPRVLKKLQSVKYLRTVVTSLLYIFTLLMRVPRHDVIHIFSASYFSFVLAPTPALVIAKLFGKKALLNYHSGEAEDHLARWPSSVSTIRLADQVAVPSEYLVRVLEKFGVQARAINNLIELDKFAFSERGPLRPLFLSNRNHEKHYGVDQVLRAFARIQAQIPDAELIVAGDGKERASLEALAVDLGLRHTKFTGRVEHDEIVEQYQRADVYLNGSEIDNQPLSILEAFACGLPVVTTDAGGIPDMVADGETGCVVRRGDHEAMAHRACLLLNNPARARSVAEAARAECENYSWEAVRDKWLEVYFELAHKSHSQAQIAKAQIRRQPDQIRADVARCQKSRIQKLSRMSFDELRIRASQLIAAFAERRGWSSLAGLPSDYALRKLLDSSRWVQPERRGSEDFFEHFRSRTKPVFFPAFENPDAFLAEFRARWPRTERQIVDAADRIIEGRFDLLGQRGLSFGEPINWHFEPGAGKTVPLDHWSRIDYLNPDVAGDKKLIWELNRHQYFLTLGQAYWLTKDEKYAEVFVAHLESWMDANPPKLGINWASSLEIAFRSISWLWAFNFFKDSRSLKSTTFTVALKFLYLNARHLETYLSTYFSPNTHLTGEALALFYLGTLLPEFREAKRWRATGKKVLVEQLERQVRTDGVYFEQSSYYHRYTTDFYTHLLILSRANGEDVPFVVAQKLEQLVDHLMYLTRPDGKTPFFGDDDGGRLVTLDRRPSNDFRAALSNGAALFKRSDYKFVAGEFAEETLWLLGPDGASEFDQIGSGPPSSQSKAFLEGGYFVMRDGWHTKANYLLFDCGPHGANNCGHAHADALAIEVTANGRPLLVDPGTHTYTGSKELRDWFRGSGAHNVLMVDGESSSVSSGSFSWEAGATCVPLSWISERRFDYVEGRHDGYERLPQPATHTRSILFLKKDYWLIRDRITSSGQHKLDLRFHFPPGSDPKLTNGSDSGRSENGTSTVVNVGAGAGMRLVVLGDGCWSREDGWVSHSYGERVAAPVCAFSAEAEGTVELVTLLLPNDGNSHRALDVREVEAIGGRAFEIVGESHRDLVLLRDPRGTRVETVRLVSDFNWTWVRFSRSSEELPEELLVLDGQRLELDGKKMLTSTKRVKYLLASRIGSEFRLETSEGLLDLTFPIEDLELFLQKINPLAADSTAGGGARVPEPGSLSNLEI